MKGSRFSTLLVLVLGSSLQAWGSSGPWLPLDVRSDQESAAVSSLEKAGIPAICWSNATVEVSDFNSTETVALAGLQDRLVRGDPRWDPWLGGLAAYFHPNPGVSRLWVVPADGAKARECLGSGVLGRPAGSQTPLTVTCWGVLGFSLLFLGLKFVAMVWSPGPPGRSPKTWAWLPVTLFLASGSLYLVFDANSRAAGPVSVPVVTWGQHRWYQESLAYGAAWTDWVPGKPWAYPSFTFRDGRLTEVPAYLAQPDAAWSRGAFSSLDPHHAARIFGPENP